MERSPSHCAVITALALATALCATSAHAQSICPPHGPCKAPAPMPGEPSSTWRWARAGAINAGIGGFTAGVFALVRGEPVLPALGKGAAGGTVSFGGRAISGRHWSGAGLIGRQVSATGASMIANAAHGRGLLEQIALPIGPVTLHLHNDTVTSVRASVDALSTIFTVYAIASPDYTLDWRASLSSGAAVFHAPDVRDDTNWRGGMVAGTILIRYDRDHPDWAQIRAHEQIHIAQHDLSARIWGEPLEHGLLGLVPHGERVARRVHFGLDFLFWAGVHVLSEDHLRTPWEREARLLAGQ